MKILFALIFIIPGLFLIAAVVRADSYEAPPSIDRVKMLRAIAAVEDWKGRLGSAGEVGPWQILPSVLKFYRGKSPKEAAQAHLEWICASLHRLGYDENSYTVALVWGGGLQHLKADDFSAAKKDYAARVYNVYGTL